MIMKNKLIAALTITFIIALFMVSSFPATVLAAPAAKEDFHATMTYKGSAAPAKLWWDEEGVMHARGVVETFDISGGLAGTAEVTVNQNLLSGTGDAQGKGSILTAGGDVYQISLDVTLTAGVPSGTFVIHGTGSCKGIYITGTVSMVGYALALDGTKLTTKP